MIRNVYDYTKLNCHHARYGITRSPLLDFRRSYSERTHEYGQVKVAEYRGCKFILHDNGRTIFEGSLHKYKNDGHHNYNRFTRSELLEVISDLGDKFQIMASEAILLNLEVGVNISPPHCCSDILDSLLLHRNVPFKDISLQKQGNYKQASHCQELFTKAYDKGAHYELLQEILRYELKYCKMRTPRVKSLADLHIKANMERLSNLLLTQWESIIMFEFMLWKAPLDQLKSDLLWKWNNRNYWLDLDKQQTYKEKKKMKDLAMKFHGYNIHDQLRDLISDELKTLLER